MAEKFFVSRQRYYYSGECVVEVVSGGRDYANADMLVPEYEGEGEEYTDPIEAVEAAIRIKGEWNASKGEEFGWSPAKVAVGSSGGMGMELEPDTDEYAMEWAKKWADRILQEQDDEEEF